MKSISIHYVLGFLCLEVAIVTCTAGSSDSKAMETTPKKTAVAAAKSVSSSAQTARASSQRHSTNINTKAQKDLGEVLELKQTHRLYGPVTVLIANNAVSVVSRGRDFKFICKAPKWDAVSFNDVRKIVYTYRFDNWRKNGICSALSVENNNTYTHWPLNFSKKCMYSDVDVTVYDLPTGPSTKFAKGPIFGEYWLHKREGVDPTAVRFLQDLYNLPVGVRGIPMRFTRAYGGHAWGFGLKYNKEPQQVATWLTTTSARVREVSASLFSVPVGYAPASDSEVLMRTGEVEETFGQILD